MANKEINLTKSIYELCSEYPELSNIMVELGFRDITKPGMLATVGRFMTLPKGAAAKKIDMELIKQTMEEHGFHIVE